MASDERHGNELAITLIETDEVQVIGKLGKIRVRAGERRDRHLLAKPWVALIAPQPLEESIADARLSRRGKVPSVFRKDSVTVVYQHDPLPRLPQRVDADNNATWSGFRVPTIRHDAHSGIDDHRPIHA